MVRVTESNTFSWYLIMKEPRLWLGWAALTVIDFFASFFHQWKKWRPVRRGR